MNSTTYSALLATAHSLAAYERDGQLKSWCWPRKDAFHNHLRFFIMGLVQREECIWLDPERDNISFNWLKPLEHLQIQWHIRHPAARGLRVRMDARLVNDNTLEHAYVIDASEQSALHDTKLWFLMAPEIAGHRSQFQCVRAGLQGNQIRCDGDPYYLTLEAAGNDKFRNVAALQIDAHSTLGSLVQSFVSHPAAFRSIEMGRCAALALSQTIRWNTPFTLRLNLHSATDNHLHTGRNDADTTHTVVSEETLGAQHSNSLSLRVLDALTSPNGALLASAECDWDMRFSGGYGFVWPRDAAFAGLALLECGYTQRAARIADFLSKALGQSHDFEQRYTDSAQPAPSWCLRQPDQRPLVCLLWIALLSSSQVTEKCKNELRMKLNSCLSAMADELLGSPETALTGFDLWEEREGQHFFALVAAYGALIRGGNYALTDAGQERYAAAAQVAAHLAHNHFSPLHAWPARTRSATGHADYTADASLLACLMPVPEFPLSEQQRSTLFYALREALKHGVGYRRYAGDTYRGGGCWPLVGLWFALAAREVLPTTEAGAFMRAALHEASAASTPLGYLPEQIDPESSQPTWVVPLAWSHAFFMQVAQRSKKHDEAQITLDNQAISH